VGRGLLSESNIVPALLGTVVELAPIEILLLTLIPQRKVGFILQTLK
jgi:hypothetical protein